MNKAMMRLGYLDLRLLGYPRTVMTGLWEQHRLHLLSAVVLLVQVVMSVLEVSVHGC